MAKITTITNPLTGQPAQVDQLDHTAQQIDDAIARALPGGAIDIALQNKLGGIESTDYPGCYYRMVDGVVEWFNPPMQVGDEYRTTERWRGYPVYVIQDSIGPNTDGSVAYIGDGANGIVRAYVERGDRVPYPLYGGNTISEKSCFYDFSWGNNPDTGRSSGIVYCHAGNSASGLYQTNYATLFYVKI